MSIIWHLRTMVVKRRKKLGLPPVEDPNDLPDPREAQDYISVRHLPLLFWFGEWDICSGVFELMRGTGFDGERAGEVVISAGGVCEITSMSFALLLFRLDSAGLRGSRKMIASYTVGHQDAAGMIIPRSKLIFHVASPASHVTPHISLQHLSHHIICNLLSFISPLPDISSYPCDYTNIC